MSVNFRRSGFITKEALLLTETPGASGAPGAGQLVFLTSNGGSDRVHRMDLSRLRRFSIDRESKAARLVVQGVLTLLGLSVAAMGLVGRGDFGYVLAVIFGSFTLACVVALFQSLTQAHVSLTFEDAQRTRSFKVWASRAKLRRFRSRLESAVAAAQPPR